MRNLERLKNQNSMSKVKFKVTKEEIIKLLFREHDVITRRFVEEQLSSFILEGELVGEKEKLGVACKYCGKTYSEHLQKLSGEVARPKARYICLMWAENFVPNTPLQPPQPIEELEYSGYEDWKKVTEDKNILALVGIIELQRRKLNELAREHNKRV